MYYSHTAAPLTHIPYAPQHFMRAAVLEDLGRGTTKGLVVSNVPIPSVHAGDVLVRVHASSINPLDNQMRYLQLIYSFFFFKSFFYLLIYC
jgi:NADPH:quinone reductase-like Zn-dependent oxidoreductase